MKGKYLRLNGCRKGARLKVVTLQCGSRERKHFCAMGLIPGCRVTVLSRSSDGASVVKTGDTNLILDCVSGESVICVEDHFFYPKS